MHTRHSFSTQPLTDTVDLDTITAHKSKKQKSQEPPADPNPPPTANAAESETLPNNTHPTNTTNQRNPLAETTTNNRSLPIPPPPQPALLDAISQPADLSTYASLPDSRRHALVDTWICNQLEDDNFLKLCQDVDANWKRIFLGE